MIRGTTPTYTFELPHSTSRVAEAKVTFSQNETMVEKKLKDCAIGEDKLSVRLTQEDTLKFCTGVVEIIVRVLMDDEDALASEPMYDMVTGCKDNEVLVCSTK